MEAPRYFALTNSEETNAKFSILRHSNSQTALPQDKKNNCQFLSLQRSPSNGFNGFEQQDSDTGGAVGSSIHFTMEENSMSFA